MIMSSKEKDFQTKITELVEVEIIPSTTVEARMAYIEELKGSLDEWEKSHVETKLLKLFKALGNEKRLQILRLISQGVVCQCELEVILDLSQATVSHHLKALREAGIITLEKQGRWSVIKTSGEYLTPEFLFELVNKAFE